MSEKDRKDKVVWEKDGHIAWIKINRPEVMNAIDLDVWGRMPEVAKEIGDDRSIRVAILTGAGDKAFSAGLDLKAGGQLTAGQAGDSLASFIRGFLEKLEELQACWTSLEKLRVPVIAAVNGYCLGAACELILACDIRLASERAVFSIPEVLFNIVPDQGSTQRLPRIVGQGMARELMFTGKRIDAMEALRIGLVNHVYPHEELLEKAKEMALQIASNGPLSVEATKRALNMSMRLPLYEGLEYEALFAAANIIADDTREGLVSQIMKKKADFKRK
jgi:enoyl-CoA hydratase